jgi:hypothetical protein
MPHKLKITADFTYFHHGYVPKSYTKGEEIETDDEEFVAVVLEQKWATKGKAKNAAPAQADSHPDNTPDNTPADPADPASAE